MAMFFGFLFFDWKVLRPGAFGLNRGLMQKQFPMAPLLLPEAIQKRTLQQPLHVYLCKPRQPPIV